MTSDGAPPTPSSAFAPPFVSVATSAAKTATTPATVNARTIPDMKVSWMTPPIRSRRSGVIPGEVASSGGTTPTSAAASRRGSAGVGREAACQLSANSALTWLDITAPSTAVPRAPPTCIAQLIAEREGLDVNADPRPRIAVAAFSGVMRMTGRLWGQGADASMEAIRALTESYLDHLGPALAENWRTP